MAWDSEFGILRSNFDSAVCSQGTTDEVLTASALSSEKRS